MAVNLSPLGGVGAQFFDNSGNPLTGGKIYTYAAGTTTPQTAYTSSTGSTPHTNPIILDAAGRVPGGEIWLTDGLQYKFVLKTSVDVLIATYDNIVGINSNFINYTSEQEIQTATAGQTVFTLTTMQYQPGTNSLSVFVDGVNQYGPGAQYAYVETDATTVTFISGLHVGASVKFTTAAINASSYGDAFQISYTPPFTGSVATNVGDKLAQTVSVKDFGAVGNGITDNTATIQAAIDAVFAAGGGIVEIPPGKFDFVGPLNIKANVELVGQGYASRLHCTTTSRTNGVISTGGAIGSHITGIRLKNFRLTGTATYLGGVPSVINGGGVDLAFCDNCEVSGLYISGWSDQGIGITDSNSNKIYKNSVSVVAQGIQVFSKDENSTGNIVEANTVTNTGTYDGIIIEGGAGGGVGRGYGNVVSNNFIDRSYERGITCNLSFNSVVTGNSVFNSGQGTTASNMGIFMFGSPGSSVTGNVVNASDGYGIVMGANSGDSIVSGNTTTNNISGSCLITDQGISSVLNISVQSNRFVEGNIATSGNVTFLNTARSFKFQNVAVADTTTLDWYEENTFTPVVAGTISAGIGTYTAQVGRFTRIGNIVNFTIRVAWSAHTGTGNTIVTGLPYTSANVCPYPISVFNNGFAPSSGQVIQGVVQQNASEIALSSYSLTTGAASALPIDASVADFIISGQYQV